VRIPKKDSEYVQIGLTYQDDTSKLFFADGARYDNAVIKREEYEKNLDRYQVGCEVRMFYSSSEKDGKKRWFLNLVV
jgi:hypothetical protein